MLYVYCLSTYRQKVYEEGTWMRRKNLEAHEQTEGAPCKSQIGNRIGIPTFVLGQNNGALPNTRKKAAFGLRMCGVRYTLRQESFILGTGTIDFLFGLISHFVQLRSSLHLKVGNSNEN